MPHHVRPHHGVVTDRYKLVRFDRPDLDAWELFDLEKDPHELRSVYGEPAYRAVVDDMKQQARPPTLRAQSPGRAAAGGIRSKAVEVAIRADDDPVRSQ